jgi:hypothetical protein
VCDRSLAGIAGSNIADDMDACLFSLLSFAVGSGLCNELTSRLEQPYRMRVCVFASAKVFAVYESQQRGGLCKIEAVQPQKKSSSFFLGGGGYKICVPYILIM